MSTRSKYFYHIGPSKIQGRGVISNRDFKPGEEIDIAISYEKGSPKITSYFGSLINHSWNPNSYLKYNKFFNSYFVHATYEIHSGEEITLDYRNTPWFIAPPDPNWK